MYDSRDGTLGRIVARRYIVNVERTDAPCAVLGSHTSDRHAHRATTTTTPPPPSEPTAPTFTTRVVRPSTAADAAADAAAVAAAVTLLGDRLDATLPTSRKRGEEIIAYCEATMPDLATFIVYAKAVKALQASKPYSITWAKDSGVNAAKRGNLLLSLTRGKNR